MNFYLSALWEVISHFGQLQFFVYLWLVITFIAWWKNSLTTRRLWMATTYVGLTMLLFVAAMYYRLAVIVDHATLTGMTAAMATYVFVSFVGGMWTAMGINKLAIKQRGWLFLEATRIIRLFATCLEKKIDVIQGLRKVADKLEKKAEDCDPLYRVQVALETAKENK